MSVSLSRSSSRASRRDRAAQANDRSTTHRRDRSTALRLATGGPEWEWAEPVNLRIRVPGRSISLGRDAARDQEGHARMPIAETRRSSFSVAPLAA